MSAPFKVNDGMIIRLRSKKGLKNRDGTPDWYLAVVNGKLVHDGGVNKSSEWTIKNVGGSIYTLKSSAGNYHLGINEQLQPVCDADVASSARLEFVWLATGKLCMMSDNHRAKKNRTGNAGPHVGVEPKGGLIGNAGRGEWGQWDAMPVGEVESTASTSSGGDQKISVGLSTPNSPATQLLANYTKHREMFGVGRFVIEQKPTKRVKTCLIADIKLPNLKTNRWCVVACAPPSPLQIQNVTGATLKVYDVTGTKLLSGSDMIQGTNGHYLLRSLARGAPHQIQARYECEAQLYSITLKSVKEGDFIPIVQPLNAELRAYHLKPTSLIDYQNESFAQWVHANQLHPMLMSDGTVESVLCFAYRVFLFIKIYFSYVWAKDVKGRKASETIGYRCTDCGGFCILFSAIMRMHGIPSRLLFGRWSSTAGEGEQNVHVKGEFYADGIGWIPFDPASAITGDHVEPYTKFFGNDNGNLLCMHLDHNISGIDIVIDGVKQVEFNQGIAFWADGEGNFNNQSFVQKWTVTNLDS